MSDLPGGSGLPPQPPLPASPVNSTPPPSMPPNLPPPPGKAERDNRTWLIAAAIALTIGVLALVALATTRSDSASSDDDVVATPSAVPTEPPRSTQQEPTPISVTPPPQVVPDRSFDEDDPWVDTLYFDVDGVGTKRLGNLALGGPVNEIEDIVTAYTGFASQLDENGRLYWGRSPTRYIVRLDLDERENLTRFDVHLDEVQSNRLKPVFVGRDGWLMPGTFRFDQAGRGDRWIYMYDDEDGFAVRCNFRTVCLHQEKVVGPDGALTAFGQVISYHGDLTTATDTRISAHVTNRGDGITELFAAPESNSAVAAQLDLTNGVTAGVLGQIVIDSAGDEWVRVTPGRARLQPSGWLRFDDNYEIVDQAADALGPLPRLEPAQPEIAQVIGRRHDDPFEFFDADIFGLGLERGDHAIGGGISRWCCPDEPPYFVDITFSTDAFETVNVILSISEQGDEWEGFDAWTFRLGTDQLWSDGSDGRCDFLDGHGPSMLIVNTDYEPIRGWTMEGTQFVEADVSRVECQAEPGSG